MTAKKEKTPKGVKPKPKKPRRDSPKMGRRPIFENKRMPESEIKRIETMAGLGLTNDQIALCLDMAPSSFYNYMEKDDRIRDAIRGGKAKTCVSVANALLRKALNGDVTAQKFFLTNRDGANWKDQKNLTHDVGNETLTAIEAFKEALKK